jgi:hypothetical protein
VQPLTGVDMVSVAGIDDVDDDARQVAYSLHLHSGPAEQFPIVKRTVGGRLHKGWCYLLDPTLGRPLLLAPLWLAATCEKCRRLEIFAAPGLMLGPPGRSIALRAAVVTDHETTAEIPRAESLQALHEAVCAVRREGPKQRAEEPR